LAALRTLALKKSLHPNLVAQGHCTSALCLVHGADSVGPLTAGLMMDGHAEPLWGAELQV
jgi:hypothetical protein